MGPGFDIGLFFHSLSNALRNLLNMGFYLPGGIDVKIPIWLMVALGVGLVAVAVKLSNPR